MSNNNIPGSNQNVNVQVNALTIDPAVTVQYKTKILHKNVVNGVNTLTQEMMSAQNTKYVIKYDYVLGEDVTIPTNCILEFDGGSINGTQTLTGNNTGIEAGLVKIFNTDIDIDGTWSVLVYYSEWFGAIGNKNVDNTQAIQKTVDIINSIGGGVLKFTNQEYKCQCIDLTTSKNITLEGDNSAVLPFKNSSKLTGIGNNDFLIKIVDNYNDTDSIPSTFGQEIVLKNLYLEGNNTILNGVNLKAYNKLINCVVRHFVQDGIVFENGSYPILLHDVESSFNGRHGIYIKPLYTTVYQLYNIHVDANGGYGLYITGGSSCTFSNIICQVNHVGGIKIEQKTGTGVYPSWLNNLSFNCIYTEGNGLLQEDDEKFEGNYTLVIKGLSTDPMAYANKIDFITIINCILNQSTSGKKSSIEGTRELIFINSVGFSVDYTKNIAATYNRTCFKNIQVGNNITSPVIETLGRFYKSITGDREIFQILGYGNTNPLNVNWGSVPIELCGDALNVSLAGTFTKTSSFTGGYIFIQNATDKVVFYYKPFDLILGEFYINSKTTFSDGEATIIHGYIIKNSYNSAYFYNEDKKTHLAAHHIPESGTIQIIFYNGILRSIGTWAI